MYYLIAEFKTMNLLDFKTTWIPKVFTMTTTLCKVQVTGTKNLITPTDIPLELSHGTTVHHQPNMSRKD